MCGWWWEPTSYANVCLSFSFSISIRKLLCHKIHFNGISPFAFSVILLPSIYLSIFDMYIYYFIQIMHKMLSLLSSQNAELKPKTCSAFSMKSGRRNSFFSLRDYRLETETNERILPHDNMLFCGGFFCDVETLILLVAL